MAVKGLIVYCSSILSLNKFRFDPRDHKHHAKDEAFDKNGHELLRLWLKRLLHRPASSCGPRTHKTRQ